MSASNEPRFRWAHSTVTVGNYLYMWVGRQMGLPKVHSNEEKKLMSSFMDVCHLPTGKWERKPTTGTPPLGTEGYATAAIGNEIFYFGGTCSFKDCYHNSLYSFNVVTFNWKELSPTTPHHAGPMMKAYCGMEAVQLQGEDYLVVIGGCGSSSSKTSTQAGAQYSVCTGKEKMGCQRCNEIHYYKLSTGEWISPAVTGDRPPPIDEFTLTSVTNETAVLFGGDSTDGESDKLYTFNFTKTSVAISELSNPGGSIPWPAQRRAHSSVQIKSNIGPHLLVLGGSPPYDCWLFNINKSVWIQIQLPVVNESEPYIGTHRWFHSLSVWNVTPTTKWIIAFGGIGAKSDMAVIELRYTSNEWCARVIPLDQYQNQEKLQERREWEIDLYEERVQQLQRQVEDGQQREQQLEKVKTSYKEQLQKEIKEKEQIQQILQERDEQVQEKATFEAHIDQLQKELQKGRQLTSHLMKKQKGKEVKTDTVSEKDEAIKSLKNKLEEEKKEEKKLRQELQEKVESLQQQLQQFIIPQSDMPDSSITVAGCGLFRLKADDCPSSFNWNKYGFRLHCPEGAVSKDTEVTVTPLLSDQFEVPKGTVLVSAVYKIEVSKPLTKQVVIELQHCVDLRNNGQTGCLKFVRAPLKCPYQFCIIDGGAFCIGNRYGSIERDDFCAMGIVAEMSNGGSSNRGRNGGGGGEGSSGSSKCGTPTNDNEDDSSNSNQEVMETNDDSLYVNEVVEEISNESNQSVNVPSEALAHKRQRLQEHEENKGPPLKKFQGETQAVESISEIVDDTETIVTNDTGFEKLVEPGSVNFSQEESQLESTPGIFNEGSSADIESTESEEDIKQKPNTKHNGYDVSSGVSPCDIMYVGMMYHEREGEAFWKSNYTVIKDLDVLIQYLETNYLDADRDKPYHFKFAQSNGVLHMSLAAPQQKGWAVHPSQDQMKLSQSVVDRYHSRQDLILGCSLDMSVYAVTGIAKDPLHYPIKLTGIIEERTIYLNRPLPKMITPFAKLNSSHPKTTSQNGRETEENPELAKSVFKKYLVALSNLMTIPDNMSVIALQLYSEGLVPDDTYDNIITSCKPARDKANSLLHALRATISIEPQSLKTLIEVLRGNEAFKAIADKMDKEASSHI